MAKTDLNRLSDSEIDRMFSDSHWATEFPPLLRIKQAARLAQIPVKTIYDWRCRGLLDACSERAGKYVIFFRDRFVRHLASGALSPRRLSQRDSSI